MEGTTKSEKHMKSSVSSESDEEVAPRYTLEAKASLTLLPDDCLLSIMKFLGPVELDNLSRTSERLRNLVYDKRLWKRVDFRPYKLTAGELTSYLKYFQRSTKFLAVQGFVNAPPDCTVKREAFTPKLLNDIRTKCPYLETLILDEHYGVAFEFNVESFPESVRYLSMKGCMITNLDPQRSYFQRLHMTMPFVKVLILSNCTWVSPHDFMALSKCYQLEELRLDGCPQLGECVAYTGLAARFGFHNLKILDLRNTRMGDSDVTCFNVSRKLTHLYLQCPSAENEDSDGRCGDPTCMDLPFRDDFMDSSDDEEFDLPHIIPTNNSANRVWFPPPIFLMNSPHVTTRHSKKMSHDCRRDHSLSTPCNLRKHNEREDSRDSSLPQASTSHGTLHIIMEPARPCPVRTGRIMRTVRVLRKLESDDSESSSDEANRVPQCHSSNETDLEPQKTNWSLDEHALLMSKQDSGSKRNYTGEHKNKDDDDDKYCTSTKPKRQCSEADSPLNNYKSVPMPVPADSFNLAVPGCSTSEQQDANLKSNSSVQFPSSSASSHLKDKENKRSVSDTMVESTAPASRSLRMDANCKPVHFPRNWPRHCRFKPNGPHLFRLPHHEPSRASTISDLCIIAFVVNDRDVDRAGYMRVISPDFERGRPQLNTLVVKNFKKITDVTLEYLLKLTSLRHLDVSGTSVTEGGILDFKLKRPEVHVICDFKNLPV